MLWHHWGYKTIWKSGLLQFHKHREALNGVTLCKPLKLSLEYSKDYNSKETRGRSPYRSPSPPASNYLQYRCGRMNVGPKQCHWHMLGGCLTWRQACRELERPESLPAEITRKRPRNFRVWQKKTRHYTRERKKICLTCSFVDLKTLRDRGSRHS